MTTLLDLIPLANALLLIGLVWWVATRSQRWESIAQASRIAELSAEQDILRGNLSRLERDLGEFLHTSHDVQERIWRELRGIQATVNNHVVEKRLQAVEDGILEIEQTLTTLPCALSDELRRRHLAEHTGEADAPRENKPGGGDPEETKEE